MRNLLVLLMIILLAGFIYGQPGTLKSSFGTNGKFTFDISSSDELGDIAYFSDGSFIFAGTSKDVNIDGLIVKVAQSGEVLWYKIIDVNGQNRPEYFNNVIVHEDEVIVHSFSFKGSGNEIGSVVFKFDADGNSVSSFGNNGRVDVPFDWNLNGFNMEVDHEGSLYISGRAVYTNLDAHGVVVKIKSDGILDSSFGTNGISIQEIGNLNSGFIKGMVIEKEVYVVGWTNDPDPNEIGNSGVLLKLKEDGTRDMEFGNDGVECFDIGEHAFLNAIEKQGDNHFLILGTTNQSPDDIYLRRYNLAGTIDETFGDNGTAQLDFGLETEGVELLVREDLGIYLISSSDSRSNFSAFSLDSNGSLDMAFGDNGSFNIEYDVRIYFSAGILLPNGDLLFGGGTNDFEFPIKNIEVVLVEGYPTCQDGSRNVELTACEEVIFRGQTYNTSGIYPITFSTEHGCDSTLNINVLILEYTLEIIEVNECGPVVINGETYLESGTYNQLITNVAGCDSNLTINLGIENLEAIISLTDEGSLKSASEEGQFQWLDCVSGLAVEGEIASNFTPTESGEYALIHSTGICIDTSDCLTVSITSRLNVDYFNTIEIFPNPATDKLNVILSETENVQVIKIFSIHGVLMDEVNVTSKSELRINLRNYTNGRYLIQVISDKGIGKISSFVKI